MSVGLLLSSVASSGGVATPPPPTSDPDWANVAFLAEFGAPIDTSSAARAVDILGEVYSSDSPARGSNSLSVRLGKISSQENGALQFSSSPDLGNEDFTIEAWFNSAEEPSAGGVIVAQWDNGSNSRKSHHLYWDGTNKRWIFEWSTDGSDTAGSVSFSHDQSFDTSNDGITMAQAFDGEWHHIAVTRADTVITLFVDGVVGGATLNDNDTIGTGVAIHFATNSDLRIGARDDRTSSPRFTYDSFIDDLRITVGTARYTAAFTPATGPWPTGAGDAHWSEVEVLLDFESRFGVEGKGKLTGPTYITPRNAEPIITAKGFQGVANSNGDSFYLAQTNGETWSPLGGDFTLEVFGVERRDATESFKHIAGCYRTDEGGRSFSIGIVDGTEWGMLYSVDGNAFTRVGTGRSLTQDVAYDLCVERSGTDLRFYEDGVLVHTATISVTIFDSNVGNVMLSVGAAANTWSGLHGNNFNGFIKAVRYTKGVARYEAAYTVPTLPLPEGADHVFPVITDSRWRVRILTYIGSSPRISELQFRTTIGADEQATGGYPFAGDMVNGRNAPGRGFDGVSSTNAHWAADSITPIADVWLAYDFLATKVVTEIALSTNSTGFSPTTFVVEKSDDRITWTPVTGTITAGTWTANVAQLFTLADHPV